MRRLHLPALIVAAFLWGYLAVPAHAASGAAAPRTHAAKPPERECQHDPTVRDAAAPGDLEIIDGTWFECVCELHVFVAPDCNWYEITSPAREPKAKRAKPKHRRVVIHAALPAVVS